MARPVLILIAILAVYIIETSCYRIILPTYRTPRTRRPIIRRARAVEFVKSTGDAKELYNEDEGMFTDRPYLQEDENHNETPLKVKQSSNKHNEQRSFNDGIQDGKPVKVIEEIESSDIEYGYEGLIYNDRSSSGEEDGDHLERSVRSANSVSAKRVKGRPGPKFSRSKWSKIMYPGYVNRHKRAVDIGTRVPVPFHYNPLNPRIWRPIRNPSPIFANRKRPYNF